MEWWRLYWEELDQHIFYGLPLDGIETCVNERFHAIIEKTPPTT